MRVHVFSRTLAWIAAVAILLLALTGPHVPGWLAALAVVSALALGVPAGIRQKRMERDAVRRLWSARRRSP
jgi:hypothetical protein